MKIILADAIVAQTVRESGGRLFVRTDPRRCCGGGVTYLVTKPEPEAGHRYQRFDADGFEVYFDAGAKSPPDELLLELRGRRTKRVEAYWNGCLYAT